MYTSWISQSATFSHIVMVGFVAEESSRPLYGHIVARMKSRAQFWRKSRLFVRATFKFLGLARLLIRATIFRENVVFFARLARLFIRATICPYKVDGLIFYKQLRNLMKIGPGIA